MYLLSFYTHVKAVAAVAAAAAAITFSGVLSLALESQPPGFQLIRDGISAGEPHMTSSGAPGPGSQARRSRTGPGLPAYLSACLPVSPSSSGPRLWETGDVGDVGDVFAFCCSRGELLDK